MEVKKGCCKSRISLAIRKSFIKMSFGTGTSGCYNRYRYAFSYFLSKFDIISCFCSVTVHAGEKNFTGAEFTDFINSTPQYAGAAALLGYDGVNYNTNWQKEIYRPAIQTDHNLSVYGGGKVPFRVSAGYNLDQATVKVGENQKANLDFSLAPKLFKDHLSINLNVKGIYQATKWANGGAVGNSMSFDPTKPAYFPEDVTKGDVTFAKGTIWNWYDNVGSPNTMASVNPLSNLYEWIDNNRALRSIGNLQVDYKIHGLEDLRLNANFGYDVAKLDGYKYNKLGSATSGASITWM